MKNEKKMIQFESSIENVRPLKDGSMSLTFHTQEMADEDKLIVLNLLGKFGWLLFKEDENAWDFKDAPTENSGFDDGKKPSQQLRGVIFVYWKQYKEQQFPDFEVYYRRQIQTLVQQYKDKLN